MPIGFLLGHHPPLNRNEACQRALTPVESPRRIILVQLKRSLECRHDNFQLPREAKRPPEVFFNRRTGHDATSRHQNSDVGAAVDNHDVWVQVLNRLDDRVRHGPRLKNGADAIVVLRILDRH